MFLITVPANEFIPPEDNILNLKAATVNVATFSEIQRPPFRPDTSNTMDVAMKEVQQMGRLTESLLRKMMGEFQNIMKLDKATVMERLLEERQLFGNNITYFSWDTERYLLEMKPIEMSRVLLEQYRYFDYQVTCHMEKFREKRKNLAKDWNLRSGKSLLHQDLSEIIQEEKVIDTDYIQSVYVMVEHNKATDWMDIYESLHDSVVARSSCLEAEDDEYKLFSVVIVRDDFEEFQQNCSTNGFVVRDYWSQPTDLDAVKYQEYRTYGEELKRLNTWMINFLKPAISGVFELLLHLKVYWACTDSFLRYGHQNFQMFLFHPMPLQNLKAELGKMFERRLQRVEKVSADSDDPETKMKGLNLSEEVDDSIPEDNSRNSSPRGKFRKRGTKSWSPNTKNKTMNGNSAKKSKKSKKKRAQSKEIDSIPTFLYYKIDIQIMKEE